VKPPVYDPGWPEDVRALYRHDLQEMWDRSVAPQIWNQYHNQLDLYLRIAGDTPLRILDVGCAQGTLALMLAERGHTVTAIDIRPQFLAYAKSRYTKGDIQFIAANALEDELPGEHDLIFANQVIEHLVYPRQFLSRLGLLLKPGGCLVTTTPNHDYIKNHLPNYTELGDPRGWEHLQFTADGDGHFFAYSAEELQTLFESVGFAQVRTRYFESPFISGHMKLRYLHGTAPAPALQALDRLMLALPVVGRISAHQLLTTGVRPGQAG
jgi:SAM-dependent methyltransferase